MAKTVFHDSVRDIAESREDNDTGQPNFETVHVVAIHIEHPSKEEVVDDSEGGRRGDSVVGEHVGHHAQLVMDRGIGPEESYKLLVDWTKVPPRLERVEHEFVATISVSEWKIISP